MGSARRIPHGIKIKTRCGRAWRCNIQMWRNKERETEAEDGSKASRFSFKAEVGFFQVEEVLIPKIQSSPAKSMLELYAGVEGEEMKRYM